MGLQFASLNSGSNGNAYYIGNSTYAVLIDAGISCREIENRLKELHLDVKKIKALFISHEHTDHVKGVDVFAGKYQLPVFISKGTYKKSRLRIPSSQLNWIVDNSSVIVNNLCVNIFSKLHDAAEPQSFTIQHNNVTVGVFTDIGDVCDNVIKHFKTCHAAFLEANYDEEMLKKGNYPFVLKQRISGGNGHLSNAQALELFLQHRPAFMTHLLLSHLSAQNNHPSIVEAMFAPYSQKTKIVVASRSRASELLYISANDSHAPNKKIKATQASLF